MEIIGIILRTTKTSGSVGLRFRLVDGRKVCMYYNSGLHRQGSDAVRPVRLLAYSSGNNKGRSHLRPLIITFAIQ